MYDIFGIISLVGNEIVALRSNVNNSFRDNHFSGLLYSQPWGGSVKLRGVIDARTVIGSIEFSSTGIIIAFEKGREYQGTMGDIH